MTVISLLYLVVCSLPISGNLLLYKTLNGLFKTWKVCVILFKTWQLESSAIWVDSVHLLALGEDQKRNNSFKFPFYTLCTIRKKLLWVLLAFSSPHKRMIIFIFYILCWAELPELFFFFLNLTLIYFSSSLRLKQWKERNYSVGPNNLFETLTAERLK